MSPKILLIEDDMDVRENVAEILELSDYEVFTAINGVEGVKMAADVQPDLIICDVMMPEMDGYGVLYTLAKNPDFIHVPFVFLTAKTEKEDQRKGMQMGADDYLTKPFDSTELLFAVEMRLKKSAQIKEHYSSNMDGVAELAVDAEEAKSMDELLEECNSVDHKKKDVIYREGAVPNQIYYLESGKVKTIKLHEDGKELIVDIFNSGEFFGIVAAMSDSQYYHSAICLEDSEIRCIPIDQFRTILQTNSEVASKLISILAGDVRSKELELLEIAYGTVRSRVADGLLKLGEKYQAQSEEGIPLTREEIAQFIGIATETLIRTLSDFKEEGFVHLNGKKIVPQVEKLTGFKY